jgi:hypothetical protein
MVQFSLESADTRWDFSCKRTGKHYTNVSGRT